MRRGSSSYLLFPLVLAFAACSGSEAGGGGAEDSGLGGGGAGGGGAASGQSGASGTGGASAACAGESTHSGEATYYDFADGSGNCSFDPTPNDLMVGAMNDADYAGSAACGACAHVVGPSGEVTVRIVDRCPECPQGDIDLSPEAFVKIAELALGRVPITWKYVPCNVSGPIAYRFKEGSNQWWTALQIRNHRHRIAKLEWESSGSFLAINRESYNYFVVPSGMGPGPYNLRVTDVYGNALVDTGIPHQEAQTVPGAAQFPPCAQ